MKHFRPPESLPAHGVHFTPRELEIVSFTVKGLDNTEIAAALGISGRTISFHQRHLYQKLKVHSMLQACIWCLRNKVVDLEGEALSSDVEAPDPNLETTDLEGIL